MKNYVIELWDTSPQLGDIRNPSILIFKMQLQCSPEMLKKIYDNLGEFRRCNTETNAYEVITTTQPI